MVTRGSSFPAGRGSRRRLRAGEATYVLLAPEQLANDEVVAELRAVVAIVAAKATAEEAAAYGAWLLASAEAAAAAVITGASATDPQAMKRYVNDLSRVPGVTQASTPPWCAPC